MGDSSIQWTDKTWNPVRGCTKVSPGCKFCYAEAFAERWRGVKGHPYEQGFDLRLVPEKLMEPLSWRAHQRVFVNSMSDLFLQEISDEYIDKVFATMLACHVFDNVPDHTFQVLTKRAERLESYFAPKSGTLVRRWGAAGDGNIIVGDEDISFSEYVEGLREDNHPFEGYLKWPLPNLWLGVSVEDRKYGLPRIQHLRRVPAWVRFLSVEPLLEDLGGGFGHELEGIDWVIVGGESGQKARPLNLEWVRSMMAQCRAANVPVFVKQLGGVWARENRATMPDGKGGTKGDTHGGWPGNWPKDLRVREWPEAFRGAKP